MRRLREMAQQGALKAQDWIGIITVVMAAMGFVFGLYNARASAIETIIHEHEIRLTKREANSFTAQEANALSMSVTKLSVEFVEHQKQLERFQAESEKVSEALDALKYSLRVDPSEVMAEVKRVNQRLDQLSDRLP